MQIRHLDWGSASTPDRGPYAKGSRPHKLLLTRVTAGRDPHQGEIVRFVSYHDLLVVAQPQLWVRIWREARYCSSDSESNYVDAKHLLPPTPGLSSCQRGPGHYI